jgi:hypothetical protein
VQQLASARVPRAALDLDHLGRPIRPPQAVHPPPRPAMGNSFLRDLSPP